jgi:HEAT repeat protein
MKKFVFILIASATLGSQCWMQTLVAGENPKQAENAPPDPEYNGKPLSQWLDTLSSRGNYNIRIINEESKDALLHIGTNALPLLLRGIAKPESGWSSPEQYRALEGFEVLGSAAKLAVPDLINLIGQNQDYPERALVFIGKVAVPALADKLIETLSDTNNPFFFNGHFIAARPTSGFNIRNRILDIFDQEGTNAEAALPALIRTATFKLPAFDVTPSAKSPFVVIAHVGQNHLDIVVPVLLKKFTDSDLPGYEPGLIAQGMVAIGTNQADLFMPLLIAALPDHKIDDWSRSQIGAALTVLGYSRPDVLMPVFLNTLMDRTNSESLRCSLAANLSEAGKTQPDIVIPALVMTYTNCTVEGRSSIAGLLAGFGDKAGFMVPSLMQDSRSKDLPINRPGWKIALAVSAKKIAPENTNALSSLLDDFDSCDGGTQQQRFRAFGELGTNGLDAVPTMLKFLANDTTQLRCDAIEALDAVGVKSDTYIADLAKIVSDTNYFVAHYSQASLCTLAADSQLAFNTVLKDAISAHVDNDVQEQAKYRLLDISRKDPKFLVSSLDSPDPAVRSGALVIFYPLNQCVRESFRKLERMSHEEPDSAIRALADMVFHLQLGLQ